MSNAENRSAGMRALPAAADGSSDDTAHPALMRALFNRSARYYNLANQLFSLGTGGWYRRFCLRRSGLRPGMVVVDIATGTGLLAREALALTKGEGLVIGIDVSEEMLAIAQSALPIPLLQGAAEALPLRDGCADAVTIGYGLRHVTDLPAAFNAARRVLKPGGVLVLLEVSAPRPRLLRGLVFLFTGCLLPALSWLMTRDKTARGLMRYHWQSMQDFMPPEAVLTALTQSGFTDLRRISYLDLFHHYTAHKAAQAAT